MALISRTVLVVLNLIKVKSAVSGSSTCDGIVFHKVRRYSNTFKRVSFSTESEISVR